MRDTSQKIAKNPDKEAALEAIFPFILWDRGSKCRFTSGSEGSHLTSGIELLFEHLQYLLGRSLGPSASSTVPPVSCPTARVSQAGFRELAFLSPPYNPTGISAIGYIQPNFALEKRPIYLDGNLISLTYGTVLHRRMRFCPQEIVWTFR